MCDALGSTTTVYSVSTSGFEQRLGCSQTVMGFQRRSPQFQHWICVTFNSGLQPPRLIEAELSAAPGSRISASISDTYTPDAHCWVSPVQSSATIGCSFARPPPLKHWFSRGRRRHKVQLRIGHVLRHQRSGIGYSGELTRSDRRGTGGSVTENGRQVEGPLVGNLGVTQLDGIGRLPRTWPAKSPNPDATEIDLKMTSYKGMAISRTIHITDREQE
ncbi:hypothetical protein VTI28DRAFT_1387 [Corynascus sepedonium]